MKNKVIAFAVAGVLAAPVAAQAGVEVYGKARLSFGSISNDADTTNNGVQSSKLAVSSHASRLGFKGAEDLGNGMKAVWQIEKAIDFTDKGTDLTARNTFVGLSGNFGTALLGAHDTPYKLSTGSLDPFGDTFADYNAVIDSNHDARSPNVLAYISPAMSGLTVAAAFVGDFVDDNLKDSKTYQKSQALSLAGMYNNGPLYASLAYQSVSDYSGTPKLSIAGGAAATVDSCSAVSNCGSAKATKLGLGYKMAPFNFGFVYEQTKLDLSAGVTVKQTNTYLSGVMDAGNGVNVKAAFGKKGNVDAGGTVSSSGATFYALGVGKNMTANTELYALVTSIKDGKNAYNVDNGSGNLGVGNQVIGAAGAAGGDLKASALVVGINHNFSSM